MYTTVQQYLSQYKNINLSTKIKVAVQKIEKNGKKNTITVQQCVSHCSNTNFSKKNKSFGTEKYFLKKFGKNR